MSQAMLELKGCVERIRFYNEHSGFVILKLVKEEDGSSVMLLGHAHARPQEGQVLCARGHVEVHPQFGAQFVADEPIVPLLPQSESGLIKWLASGAVRGIGAVWAERLVKHFGPSILEILAETPERLSEIEGLGAQRRASFLAALKDQRQQLEIASYMASLGLGPKRTQTLLTKYGASIVPILQEHPYQLYRENRGIGFVLADTIARRNGLPETSDERLEAAMLYILEEQAALGHCYTELPEMTERLSALLGYDLDRDRVEARAIAQEDVSYEDGCVSLQSVWESERRCAVHLIRLLSVSMQPQRIRMQQDALQAVLAQSQFALTEEQVQALHLALAHRVTVITGGPGVGKTTVTRALLRTYETLGRTVLLAAPTGRAAKRLKESTGREAQTIHRLLKYDPATSVFAYHERHPLSADVVIVDEMSMVDVHLMAAVLAALPEGCMCILVGDQDQLPSVGVGAVLADIMRAGCVPVAELTQIFRQARYSAIIQTAHNIRQGRMPVSDPERDCVWHRAEGPEAVLSVLDKLFSEGFEGWDPVRDVQILTCMHRGRIGTKYLNQHLKSLLNPHPSPLSLGDKVIQLKNNYDKEVFNGDMGIVHGVSDAGVVVCMDGDRYVDYAPEDMDELQLAYATTVHKSQGSEYPVVVVLMATEQFMLLNRHMLYTAVTRARKRLILIGSPKAVAIAVRNTDPGARRTRLARYLCSIANQA